MKKYEVKDQRKKKIEKDNEKMARKYESKEKEKKKSKLSKDECDVF